MDLGIAGRTALVLGGGGGLGGAIAQSLTGEGVNVAVADIDLSAAEATLASLVGNGKAIPLAWDLADLSCIGDRINTIEAELGPLDILVNNTGGPPPTPVAGQEAEVWQQYFGSTVLPVISITDYILPQMRGRGWGRVITSTSSGVLSPIPNLGISNALRISLVGWSKTLAKEVGPHGVTANIVLPGRVGTKRISFLDEKKAERENRSVDEVRAESTASIPVGRYGEPREYGDMVAFLANERAGYITGSVIRVDGGLIPGI